MSINLDPNRPIYLQIIEEIKKRAVRGEYNPGTKLPSVRDMAIEMEVNPNTIARVYTELEREGFIFTRRGLGSFITENSSSVEKERNVFAQNSAEKFVKTIKELKLDDEHRIQLINKIKNELSEKNGKDK